MDTGFLGESLGGLVDDARGFISAKPIATAAIGTAVVAGVAGAGLVVAKKKKKTTKKKTTTRKKTTKSRGRKLKFGSPAWRKKYLKKGKRKKPKYARTAGKRRDTSTRRIRMTKNGQPYVILRSGKARFIKKSSAARSRKLKGGRY